MALYMIEYDLRKHRDYATLTAELKKFAATRILESLWCFNRINTSAVALRDHFKKFIDLDDGLIVAVVTDWATTRTLASPPQ
jgi:hypothetical protein